MLDGRRADRHIRLSILGRGLPPASEMSHFPPAIERLAVRILLGRSEVAADGEHVSAPGRRIERGPIRRAVTLVSDAAALQ